MTFISGYKRVCSSAVILVTLWLGGVGCSFCCASSAQDSCCLREKQSNSRDSSFTDNSSSCDTSSLCTCRSQTTKPNERRTEISIGNAGLVGCSLLPNRIEGTTTRLNIECAGERQTSVIALPIIEIRFERSQSLLEPPPPLNRSGTYLRCNVLLI